MILGYGIIAVPTGIVTAELTHLKDVKISTQACPECSAEGHDDFNVFSVMSVYRGYNANTAMEMFCKKFKCKACKFCNHEACLSSVE
jgi:hypothetical protein